MAPDSDSDIAWMQAWRAGDQRAGAKLYRRHSAAAARFFRNKAAARDLPDLLQTTFMTCFEHGERLRADASFRAFLLGIARNVLLRHYRDHYRKHDKIDFGVSSVVELGISPTGLIAAQQCEQILLEALRSLAIEDQIMLELYYWENMSGSELAELYELPEGTLRSRLRRARRLLGEAFARLEHSGTGTREPEDPRSLATWAGRVRARLAEDEQENSKKSPTE